MAEHAVTYLQLVGGFQFLKALQLAFVNVLSSRGETRWVLAEAAITNASNVALNLLFVRAGLGVSGIALATVLSLGVGLAWTASVVHFRLRVRLPLRLPARALWQHLRPILRIGLPGALEPISFQIMHVVLNATILSLGPQTMAARVYVLNFYLVSTVLWGVAFGMGTQITVARQVGAKNFEAAHQVLQRALRLTVAGNLVLCGLLYLAHRPLLGLLTSDPEVLRIAAPLFLIAPFVEVGRAFNIVAGGALRSSGDARFTAAVGTTMMWTIGLPGSYLLGKTFGLGRR
jgi:putative MATE family efflux protein